MKSFMKMLGFLKSQWPKFVASLFFMMGFSALNGISLGMLVPILHVLFKANTGDYSSISGLSPSIKKFLIKYVFQYPPIQAVERLAIFIVIVYFLKGIFMYFGRIFTAMVNEGIARDLRNRLFAKMMELPLGFFHSMSSGDISARFINEVTLVKTTFTNGFYVILKEGLNMIAFLIVALWASWQLTLLTLILVPIASGIVVLLGKKIRKRANKANIMMGKIGKQLSEALGGIKIVKGFATEEREIEKFRKRSGDFYKAYVRFESVNALGSPLTEFVTSIIAGLILFVSAHLIFQYHTLSPEKFFVFLAASLSLMSPLKRVTQANLILQQGIASMWRLFDILEAEPEPGVKHRGRVKFKRIRNSIKYDHVYFTYDGEKWALKDINFEIRKGEKVALVGPSGAGKSTIADLLLRFYEPTKGRILIDGLDLKEYDLKSYRRKISVVPQETFLFDGTIYENIAYARPDATENEVIEAAKKAKVHEFVMKLPKKYGTFIGERGVRISGGERQRIAIARAILRDPEILILDEATSSLDSYSEEIIKKALSELLVGRTALIIAHRLSTILNADKIIVINKGEILDIGKHKELYERCKLYRELADLQFISSGVL